jgi:hypothetical protein
MQRRWREKQHSSRWPLQWRGPRLQPRRRAAAPRQSGHSVTNQVAFTVGPAAAPTQRPQPPARSRCPASGAQSAGRQTAGKLPSELRPRPKRRNGRSRWVLRHSAETSQVMNRSGHASFPRRSSLGRARHQGNSQGPRAAEILQCNGSGGLGLGFSDGPAGPILAASPPEVLPCL